MYIQPYSNNYQVVVFNRYTNKSEYYGTFTNVIAAAKIADHYNKLIGNPHLLNNIQDDVMSIQEALSYKSYQYNRLPKDMIKLIR